MNTDFDFCRGTQAKICKKCLRFAYDYQYKFEDFMWWVEPKEKNNKCKNFIQK